MAAAMRPFAVGTASTCYFVVAVAVVIVLFAILAVLLIGLLILTFTMLKCFRVKKIRAIQNCCESS